MIDLPPPIVMLKDVLRPASERFGPAGLAKIAAYKRLPALTVAAGCARKLSPDEAPGCGCKYVCLRGRSPWADTQGVDARICYECPERPPLDDA